MTYAILNKKETTYLAGVSRRITFRSCRLGSSSRRDRLGRATPFFRADIWGLLGVVSKGFAGSIGAFDIFDWGDSKLFNQRVEATADSGTDDADCLSNRMVRYYRHFQQTPIYLYTHYSFEMLQASLDPME